MFLLNIVCPCINDTSLIVLLAFDQNFLICTSLRCYTSLNDILLNFKTKLQDSLISLDDLVLTKFIGLHEGT